MKLVSCSGSSINKKRLYITIRLGAKERGDDIYPSYHVIKDSKKKCYPENVSISQNEAMVPFMDLFIHTTKRLVQM